VLNNINVILKGSGPAATGVRSVTRLRCLLRKWLLQIFVIQVQWHWQILF